jgi:hypothetical protein
MEIMLFGHQSRNETSRVNNLDPILLCSNCFKNVGISIEAQRIGTSTTLPCPKCGSVDGAKLTKEQLQTLQFNFFLGGSRVTAYFPSPIGLAGANLSPFQFEGNTWADYLLIKSLTDTELFWHGPHLDRLGLCLLRDKVLARLKPDDYPWPLDIGHDVTIDDLWDAALAVVKAQILPAGQKVFRVRSLAKNPLDVSEYDSPPTKLIKACRFNDSTHQVFYGAFDAETCIIELKLGPSEIVRNEVTIARFQLKQSLRVLNLCDFRANGLNHSDFRECRALLSGLLFPHQQDYFLTQSLSRHIEKRGYDGILHPSAFIYIGKPEAKNLVVFRAPVADGRLQLLDINSIAVDSLKYELLFGPAYHQ